MKKILISILGTVLLGMLFFAFTARAAINLIANPSLETSDPSDTSVPQNWFQGNWGTNTTLFTYATSTGNTGVRSGSITMSSYTDGDAKWYFTPITVQANTEYTFSDYYKATVPTSIVIQLTDTSGNVSYQDLAVTVPASSAWSQTSYTFTTLATTKNVTVFHVINSVGTFSVDDFSLTNFVIALQPPTISLTSPVQNATVVGTISLAASTTDAIGISNVQFKIDGKNFGAAVTTSPYVLSFDSTTVSDNTHVISGVVTNTNGLSATSSVSITVNNPIQTSTSTIANPGVEIVNPANATLPLNWQHNSWGTSATTFSYLSTGHAGTHSLKVETTSYTSGDSKWYFDQVPVTAGAHYTFSDYYQSTIASEIDVAFAMSDGTTQYLYLGAPAASASWKQLTLDFIAPAGAEGATVFHLIHGIGSLTTDDFSLESTAAPVIPTVAIVAPLNNSTASSTVLISASATDTQGIASVQFIIDGVKVGNPVTTAPYQFSWDTTAVTNGIHTLIAVAKNTSNNSATSSTVSVNVLNAANVTFVPNPSMETVDPANVALPQYWQHNSWGTNATTFTYLSTGHTGTRSVKAQMTSYTDGDAKWYFTPQAVTPGIQYQFSDYYQSTVATEVDIAFTMSDGTTLYQIIGLPEPAAAWTKFTTPFSIPLGAQKVTIYHILNKVGSLTIDDENIQSYVPVGYNRALVSLTFDDGFDTQYTQGLPILKKYGFLSTQFIVSGFLGTPGYLTRAQVKAYVAAGQEIGSHTVTHPNLLTQTAAQWKTEMAQSQKTLHNVTGLPVTDLAFPEGLYNSGVVAVTKTYYKASRGTEDALNSKDTLNVYDIKVQNIFNTTSVAQIQEWVKQAQNTKTWLVLVYHSISPDTTTGLYNTTPTQLDAQLSAIKTAGITVLPMNQALAEIVPQM